MNIIKPDGTTLDVIVTESAVHIEELMGGDYVRLSWVSDEGSGLPLGSYIEPFGDGVRYSLLKPYMPNSRNEGEYTYEPVFEHPKMILAHTPLLFSTRTAEGQAAKETDWEYTGNIGTILSRVKDIIREEAGITLTVVVSDYDGQIPASASVSFRGMDILSGLQAIASAFGGCEYHIDWNGKKLYFGFIKYEAAEDIPELKAGENVRPASVSENNTEAYNNCYIVKGSTRNMTIRTESGENIQSNARLSLAASDDDDYPKSLIDTRTDKTLPQLTGILIFDDIFPQLDLYAYNVRARIRRMRDSEGNWVVNEYAEDGSVRSYVTYATYYLRAAFPTVSGGRVTEWTDFIVSTKDIIAGKALKSYFIANESGSHSLLAGREFEMTVHERGQLIQAQSDDDGVIDSGVEISAGDYEICFEQEGDLIIPNMTTLYPWGDGATLDDLGQDGLRNDKMVFYNIIMSDSYKASAQARLKDVALARIRSLQTDTNNYTIESNAVVYDMRLHVGQHVRYTDLEGRTLDTRVLSLTTKLDIPSQVTITVGNNIIVGNTKQLQEAVVSANNNVDILTAISDMTGALSQALNRAQQDMYEGLARLKNMWEFDENGYIFTKYNAYSKGFLSAYGINASGSGGGGGVPPLVDWQLYDETIAATIPLSAYLGKDLLDRIKELEENGGGGTPVSLTWANITGKPFNSVGSGLSVTNGVLSANVTSLAWSNITGRPTKLSEFTNDSGYLTSVAYNDLTTKPTKTQLNSILQIPDWALSSSKPSYAFSEITGSVAFNQLPTMYWANVEVSNSSKTNTAPTFQSVKIGSVTLSCDTNGYLKVDKGLYSESFVSAYGLNGSNSSGGEGSTVGFTQNQTSTNGTLIGTLSINGANNSIYAPKVEITNLNTEGTLIATIKIGSKSYDLRVPTSGGTTEPTEPDNPTTYPYQYYCYLDDRTTMLRDAVGFDTTSITRPNLSGYTYEGYIYHETLSKALAYDNYDGTEDTFTNVSSSYPVVVFFYSLGSSSGGGTTQSSVTVGNQWTKLSTPITYNDVVYDVYKSPSLDEQKSTHTKMNITWTNKSDFKCYLWSDSEASDKVALGGSYDYTIASNEGEAAITTPMTSAISAKAHTKGIGNEQGAPSKDNINRWVLADYSGTANGTAWISFVTDGSTFYGESVGYVMIPRS